MYKIYCLKSKNHNWYYVGMSADLAKRYKAHELGQVKSTHFYRPFEIVELEQVVDRKTARQREKYWKSGTGKEKIKSII